MQNNIQKQLFQNNQGPNKQTQKQKSVENQREEKEQKDHKMHHWLPWTELQKLKYAIFVQKFKNQFQIGKRKPYKLFKIMSKMIKSRTQSQCRTFSYKMEKSFPKLSKLISSIKSNYQAQTYYLNFKVFEKQIEEIVEEDVQFKNMLTKYENQKSNILSSFQQEDGSLARQSQQNNSSFQLGQRNKLQGTRKQENKQKSVNVDFYQQQLMNQQLQKISAEKQKEKLITKCNYHWLQWIKANLQIQNIKQTQYLNFFNTMMSQR